MKRVLLAALLLAILSLTANTLQAQERGFGVGASVVDPVGISYKAWLNPDAALAGTVAFRISDGSSEFYTSIDYLVHKFYDELDWEVGRLHYYYGGGLGLHWFSPDVRDEDIYLRLPAGFGFNFTDVPVDVFFELAPQLRVADSFQFNFRGNLGFRFYLN